jgi:hypothetical protein
VRKDAERSAANQNGCERFDAQLANCRIDRRGATMVTRTTPPLLVRTSHDADAGPAGAGYRNRTDAVTKGVGASDARARMNAGLHADVTNHLLVANTRTRQPGS